MRNFNLKVIEVPFIQISGSIGVAKDALVEISSRLRERCLRDANSKVESTPVRPLPGFVPSEDFRSGDPQRSGAMGAGSSRRYEHLKVGKIIWLMFFYWSLYLDFCFDNSGVWGNSYLYF